MHIFRLKICSDAVKKGWVFSWEKKSFKNKKNRDLWRRFLRIYRQNNVRFVWVKGHNNNLENERCDGLAVAAAEAEKKYAIDYEYESSCGQGPKLI